MEVDYLDEQVITTAGVDASPANPSAIWGLSSIGGMTVNRRS